MTNIISRLFGKFAQVEFFRPLQSLINYTYVKIFNIDMSEFEERKFKSLCDLFTRKLRNARSFSTDEANLIAPCDSLITQSANIEDNKALQIKNMKYNVSELLDENLLKENPHIKSSANFSYINFYLSPRDYHRFHSPTNMHIEKITYIGGELLPVHKYALNKYANLFIRNERIIIKARANNGKLLYFVAIGALNVGSIIIHAEPKIITNAGHKNIIHTYTTKPFIKKGEELGMFRMGSTIVLFIEDFKTSIRENEVVKFGTSIGEFAQD